MTHQAPETQWWWFALRSLALVSVGFIVGLLLDGALP